MAAAAVAVASPPAMAGEAHAQMAAAPTVDSVGSPDANGTYGAGKIIAVTVRFSEPVNVTGTPMLALSTDPPRSAAYAGGSGSSTIEFWYAVEPGDMAARLNYTSASALSLNGGSIVRTADGTTPANRDLPLPGSPGSLVVSKAIVIDTALRPILAAADSATDNGTVRTDYVALNGANRVAVLEAGGDTYAIVTAGRDNGVQMIRVDENGTMSAAGTAFDGTGNFTALGLARGIDTFDTGTDTYAIVASGEGAVQLIHVDENGTMTAPVNGTVRDGESDPPHTAELSGFGGLYGGSWDVAAFSMNDGMGDGWYAIVAARSAHAVQLVKVNEDGSLSVKGTARDVQHGGGTVPGFDALQYVDAVDTFVMDGRTFAVAGSIQDHAVQIIQVNEDGTLSPNGTAFDGTGNFTELGGVDGIDAFDADGTPHAMVAAFLDDAVKLIRIDGNANPQYVDAAVDSMRGSPPGPRTDFDELDGASDVDVFVMDGRTYAIVTAQDDDGVQLIRVDEDDTLAAVAHARDGQDFDELNGASGVDTFAVGGNTYAIVASVDDNGVQLIRMSPTQVTSVNSSAQGGTYAVGRTISINVTFSDAVAVKGDIPELVLDTGGSANGSAVYAAGNGSKQLEFLYTVGAGDVADDLMHAGASALRSRGAIIGYGGADPAQLSMPQPGPLGSSGALVIDGERPSVLSVASAFGRSAPYAPGAQIDINVTFSKPVVVAGAPQLRLNAGADRSANYTSGSGSETLMFRYAVQAGDEADHLNYRDAAALHLNGGTIRDAAGVGAPANDADLDLSGAASDLSPGGQSGIKVDGVGPSAQSVTSPNASRTYGAEGDRIHIEVLFDEEVLVAGTPRIGLDTEPQRFAVYESGHGTHTLTFVYTVTAGDEVQRLAYTGDLQLGGGDSVRDEAGNDAAEALPDPDPGMPLGGAGGIAVDAPGAPPAEILNVTSPGGSAAYGIGSTVRIDVDFSSNVTVTGMPALALNIAGRSAVYALGNNTDTLVFAYTVQRGDESDGLDYAGADALRPGGGAAIATAADTDVPANTDLPFEGMRGLLAASADIVIDGVRPSVGSVSSPNASRTYAIGDALTVTVNFTEPVGVEGAPLLELAIGPSSSRNATYAQGPSSTALSFLYVVREGDESAGLGYTGTGALSLGGGGGAIMDAVNSANLSLPEPGSDRSLGGSKNIAIDGVRPFVESVSSPNASGTYAEGDIHIRMLFSEEVVVAGMPSIGLNTDPPRFAVYESGNGTRTLTFVYAVSRGDGTAGGGALDYSGDGALALGGGASIGDRAGNGAAEALPEPNQGAPLGGSARIVIDAPGDPAAEVRSVSSPGGNATYGIGSTVRIEVEFSSSVTVTGTPTLALNAVGSDGSGRSAAYESGNGTATLVFAYTVQPGDAADGLDYAGIAALRPDGGPIATAATGAPASLVLPPVGSPASLAGSARIAIDGAPPAGTDGEPPRVRSVFSPGGNATYYAGDTVRIAVEFSEPVSVSGTPMLALSTSPARSAAYVDGTDGDAELEFRYTVQRGDAAGPLGYAGADALSLGGGGSIRDADGNRAVLALPEPGSPGSLRASAGIAVRAGPGADADGIVTLVVEPGAAGGRFDVAGRGDGALILLDVRGLAGSGGEAGAVAFPGGAVVNASFASLSIPPGATAGSVPSDGMLVMYAASDTYPDHMVQDALSYPGSGRIAVRGIAEIGAENSTIVFDMPVRISLEGQAGGRAFYINATSGDTTAIDRACTADDSEWVHRQLGGAGECQLDVGGDKVVHTYHLTRFGTVAPASGAPLPPPVVHECRMDLGSANLAMRATPGARSTADWQSVANLGSLPFAGVALEATPWYIDPSSDRPGPGAPSLPASLTEVREAGRGGGFAALPEDGMSVAQGLGGGQNATVWFRIDLTAHDSVEGNELVQRVTYTAECRP